MKREKNRLKTRTISYPLRGGGFGEDLSSGFGSFIILSGLMLSGIMGGEFGCIQNSLAREGEQISRDRKLIEKFSPHLEALRTRELMQLAKAYGRADNHQEAVKVYTIILSKEPRNVEAKSWMAWEISQKGGGEQRDSSLPVDSSSSLTKYLESNSMGGGGKDEGGSGKSGAQASGSEGGLNPGGSDSPKGSTSGSSPSSPDGSGKSGSSSGSSSSEGGLTTASAQKTQDPSLGGGVGGQQSVSPRDREISTAFQEAIAMDPNYETSYLLAIKYYSQKKNYFEQRTLYEDLVRHKGEKKEYITALCSLTLEEKLFDLSEKYCRQGLRLDSHEATNYVNLGLTFSKTGRSDVGERFLKTASDSFSKSEYAHLSYGEFAMEKKDYLNAYKSYRRATKANPRSQKAWLGLGVMATEIQKYSEGLQALRRSCQLDRGETVKSFRRALKIITLQKKWDWVKKYEKVLEDHC